MLKKYLGYSAAPTSTWKTEVGVIPAISPHVGNGESNMKRFIKSLGIYFVAALVVLVLGIILAFIAFSNVESYASFALGFAGVFGLLLVIGAFYWASHPSTRQWPGTLIGATAAVLLVVAASIWRPFENLQAPSFGYGLLSLAIVLVVTAIFFGAAKWVSSLKPTEQPKSTANVTADNVTDISQTA